VGHHVCVTENSASTLPPDPEKYDEIRSVAARNRGLDQPYIDGGEDPQLPETLRRERPYVRLLVAMVIAIVAIGFVIGFAGALLATPVSRP
jgi:hypothetical protein